jgi:hypothetical protein
MNQLLRCINIEKRIERNLCPKKKVANFMNDSAIGARTNVTQLHEYYIEKQFVLFFKTTSVQACL